MKIFENSHAYDHPWHKVTSAFWMKYPNSKFSHVKQVDVYDRHVDEKTGELHTKRLIVCFSNLPSWMNAIGISPSVIVNEESVVSPKDQRMTLRSTNITGSDFLTVDETCVYEKDPEDSNRTTYQQEVQINSNLPAFARKMEQAAHQNYQQTATKGLEVIEFLCQHFEQLKASLSQRAPSFRCDQQQQQSSQSPQ